MVRQGSRSALQQRRESMLVSPPGVLFNNVPFTYVCIYVFSFLTLFLYCYCVFFLILSPQAALWMCNVSLSVCSSVQHYCAPLRHVVRVFTRVYSYDFLFLQQFWYLCVNCMMCHFGTRLRGILSFESSFPVWLELCSRTSYVGISLAERSLIGHFYFVSC